MEEIIFPPSPNWYLPDILDVACDGTICYGTNTNLAVLGVSDTNGDQLKITKLDIIPHVHRERVSVVCFGPPGVCGKMVATIGGDSYVKVWDTQTGVMCQVHQQHGVSARLRGMDWSAANRQLIVSVDESGTFVLFDVGANKSDKVVFPKLHATVLACCPHKWQWVAVGDVSGLVLIVSIAGTGSVIRKMRGHDNPVLSLSWSPVTGNVFLTGFKGSDSSELLLASGAYSRNAYIWRAGSDGRCQMEILQPTGPPGQPKPRYAGTAVGVNGGYVAVCWTRPNKLLTSTMWGELLCWDLDELASWQRAHDKIVYNPQQKNAGRTVLAKTHQRGLFSIACSAMHVSEVPDGSVTDWRKKEEPSVESPVLVWSTSQDRQLVATDLASGRTRLALPTLGGFVYCMALSKLDCHKVAVGAGDGTIRVWNMATLDTIDLRSIWLKIKGRVTALAWHPTHDSWLAYGTSEGRVGVYDMANTARGPTHLWSHHKKTVYSLGWGPVVARRGEIRMSTQKHFLYSCGDNMLLCYDLYKEEETLHDVSTHCYVNKEPVAANVTEFAWKDDYSVVAIGTDTGCVHLCSPPHLDVVTTVYPHKKIIQNLEWHPMVTTTEPAGSSLRHLLAFVSTGNNVKIYDFEQAFSGAQDQSVVEGASFTTISGHSERVTQVAWSPHVGGMLVTASYDGSAQIWDVRGGGGGGVKLLALFAGHSGWVVCVRWCPMDSDFVITGSSDFTLRAWRVSSQDTKKRAKPLDVLPPEVEPALEAVRVNKGKKELPKVKHLASSAAAKVEGSKGRNTTTEPGLGTLSKSHFPISSRTRNLGKDGVIASTYSLLRAKKEAPVDEEANGPTIGTGNLVHLGFFSDKDAMNRMLDMEGKHLLQSNLPEHAQNIALWKSTDVGDILEKARIEKQVTLWHIAVAPMVSARMWRDLVYAYAEQMRDARRLQDAASMLVMIHEIEEAVDMLLAEGLFREAVCIVRCHLPEDDPLQLRVFSEWAKHAELAGDYELAAHCYIAIKDLERAARTQGNRKDSKSLDLAVALAEAAGNNTLAFTLGEQAIHKHVMERSYKRAMALATEQKELQPWIWLIITHEEMMKSLEAMGKSAFAARNVDHWLMRKDCFAEVVRLIVERCTEEFLLTATEASIILNGIDGNPKSKHEVQLSSAAYIAASLAAGNEETKLIYLVKALDVCYRYHIHFPRSRLMLAVIMFAMPSPNMEGWELPTGPHVSICAFVCAGLVRWMDQECSSTFLQEDNDEETSVILQKIVMTIKCFLASALDTRAMFYYNATSQYGKYETMILKQKKLAEIMPGNVAEDVAASLENGVHAGQEDDCFENGLSKLSLHDEPKRVAQCPITTLKRLREFEVFFNKTRVAAPNPYFFYMDLIRVLRQYQEKNHVQELLENLPLVWKKREAAIADIWTMVLDKPEKLFGCEGEDTIRTEFWDLVQIRDQEDAF